MRAGFVQSVARAAGVLAVAWPLAWVAPQARAQNFPDRPVRVIVPVSPGGLVDALIRTLAPKMGDLLGQPVVVDNRAGAGGIIGMGEVVRSAPDGHTLMFYNDAVSAIPLVFAKPGFDALRDFTPITQLFYSPFMLLVHPSLPVTTAPELVAYSKKNPGKLAASIAAPGSAGHLMLETFKSVTGADIQGIPYKGAGPAMVDFIAGQTQVFAISSTLALGQVRAGKARAVAVAGPSRSAAVPEVQTTAEAGYPSVEFTTWLGLFGPAKMNGAVVQKIRDAALKAQADPVNRARFAEQGVELTGTTPEEFRRFVASEAAKFAKVAASAGIKPE